ncbi:hypothetical protein [Paenibacillus aceti]|uniref:Uncharacterized protein n=1 Tax=Paenibacillus aceti TaxID=1820010 RepID=A0ABQ1W415_9BACL|nr:hypothetical protein [Paenibacillus aceti]GGG10370.1 hypothetical protein GCM10010913_35220 [Paenibacillus aceti]
MAVQGNLDITGLHMGCTAVPGSNHLAAFLEAILMGDQAAAQATSHFGQADRCTELDGVFMETLVS